jgi:hypothetical protein
MPIPPPSERPDLYDDYDGQLYSPSLPEYIEATTPDYIKRLLEEKPGKPFSEIAKERSDETWRRALMYYAVDGAVFRKIPGEPLEQFDQEKNTFIEYAGDAKSIKLGMPMDIEDIRPFMHGGAEKK